MTGKLLETTAIYVLAAIVTIFVATTVVPKVIDSFSVALTKAAQAGDKR